jgi:hypothetical protein
MRLETVMWMAMLAVGCAKSEGDSLGSGSEQCAEYRTTYPSGPYGFVVGEILADIPGMVDRSGATQSLVDIFSDRTKRVLVLANAMDT